ncbi:OmpA family protein [Longispora sp. NPDC051575]|uniref:OmpA family protein n=1 Tax=Longispora sp. NPDC051575 TaxID=3154943 RepID=UPI00341B99F8
MALQSLAGNRAVGGLIPAGMVQRFVGPEHAELGDATGATLNLGNGVVLTWGQMVGIAGDEYGTVEEVIADSRTPEGRARLRAALEHDRVPGTLAATLPAKTTMLPSNKTAEQEQDARYNALVVANVAHFAAGGTAIATWTGHHQDALAKAMNAGLVEDDAARQIALATEAFGQHFLTDAFSGGHVRTPRADILSWYTTVFGPKVVVHLVEDLRQRLVSAFAAQIARQLPPAVAGAVPPVAELATKQATTVMEMIVGGGGIVALGRQLGVYIAGAVSGTVHDMEGERGVWVNSVAHPTPWVAYGDARMHDSPDSVAGAKAAVTAAKAQVDEAYAIGQRFRRTVALPYAPPHTVHFAFNRSDLDAAATAACESAADYLRVHPGATVDLTGHTDPVGTDGANLGLGTRRAEAIKASLVAAGVPGERIRTASRGESELVTSDPAQYRLNRRVALTWGGDPASVPSREGEEAFAVLNQRLPAPYHPVLDQVPKEVANLNVALEDWHWGSMPVNLRTGFNTWMSAHIHPLVTGLLASPKLDRLVVPAPVTIVLEPRDVATAEAKALFANPVDYLGRAFGTPAGP